MIRKYVVQINQNQEFPFQSVNPLFLSHQVKVVIQVSPPYTINFYRNQIYKAIQLEYTNPSLVHLKGVIQHKNLNKISLSYEHVPYSLKDVLNSNMNIKMEWVSQKIRDLFYFLLQNGIFPKVQSKNIGFSRNLQLKYFLLPNFKQVNKQKFNQNIKIFNHWINDLKNLSKEGPLCNQFKPTNYICDDISKYIQQDARDVQNFQDNNSLRFSQKQFKNYNTKFQKKITQIQNKIYRLKGKGKQTKSQKNMKDKKNSIKNSKNPSFLDEASDYSSSHSQSIQKQKNKEMELLQNRRSLNHNSHANLQPTNEKPQAQEGLCTKKQTIKKQKMTNSWIFQEQNKKQEGQKPHKSSWGDQLKKHKSSWGDYSTSNPNQSQKQFFLKRRISTAFQKSSYALKVYEKYQSKKSSRKSSGKRQCKKIQ